MPYEAQPTRVLLVRHGESTFNAEKCFQGRDDAAVLTGRGTATAELAGKFLCGESIDAILSSPLRRAVQTAHVIASALNRCGRSLPIDTVPDLMEIDLPSWEGLSIETVIRDFPEDYRHWRREPGSFTMLRDKAAPFHPVLELFAQARRFWSHYLTLYSGKTILAVTHAGTARALLSTALGMGPEQFQNLEQSNAALSVIRVEPGAAHPVLETMNATSHLGRALPKLKAGHSGIRLLMIRRENGQDVSEKVKEVVAMMPPDLILAPADSDHAFPGVPKRTISLDNEAGITGIANAIGSSFPMPKNRELNVVWLGPSAGIQSVVTSLLGIVRDRLVLTELSDAVVHFPNQSRSPVVQAVNVLTKLEALSFEKTV